MLVSTARTGLGRRALLIGCAYLVVAVLLDLSSGFFILHQGLAVVYPPAGLYLAAILLLGWRALPLAFASPFFSFLVTLESQHVGWLGMIAISAISMVSGALCLLLFRLTPGRGRTLHSLKDTIVFLGVVSLAETVESALSATAYLSFGLVAPGEYFAAALGWWISNLIPFLTLTPLLLTCVDPIPGDMPKLTWQNLLHAAIVLLLSPLAVHFALPTGGPSQIARLYLAFLPVVWGALTWGFYGASLVSLVVVSSFLALIASRFEGATPMVVEAQLFLLVLTISGLLMGAGVTDRKRAERERLEMERRLIYTQNLERLDLLAGGIAHDFNNLLSGIFGYLDLMKQQCRDEQVQRFAEKILQVLNRARSLTQQLLTFSRGGAPIRKTGQLNNVLHETVGFTLSGSNVRSELAIPAELWACDFDESQIAQLLQNLVLNAKQAMPDGGALKVQAENVVLAQGAHPVLPAGDYVRISVRDTGIGIAKEHLARIFEPFFTTKPNGTGLGLATSASIAKKHGGSLDAESSLGQGCTFHLYLPASRGAPADVAERAAALGHAGKGRVLVMDDEDYVREILSGMLQRMGYEVVTARNGSEALARFADAERSGRPCSLLILDLTIPGTLGGKEVVQELRRRGSQIPAIAASGYSNDPVIAEPARFGFTASLAKPFLYEDLARTLRGIGAV